MCAAVDVILYISVLRTSLLCFELLEFLLHSSTSKGATGGQHELQPVTKCNYSKCCRRLWSIGHLSKCQRGGSIFLHTSRRRFGHTLHLSRHIGNEWSRSTKNTILAKCTLVAWLGCSEELQVEALLLVVPSILGVKSTH